MNKDPNAEGREAYNGGQSETANPYPENSDDHLSWNDGWEAAAEEAEERASDRRAPLGNRCPSAA